MNQSNLLRTGFNPSALIAAALLALPAAAADSSEDTYTWSAELVAVDDQAGTITVQSRLVTEADTADLKALKSGDQATLVWSGVNWAAGVRKVTRGALKGDDRLSLPIEFVSTETEDRYVRFKVPVPRADLAKIEALAAGGWVTATSPRRPANLAEAVASVRPYNDAG